MNRSLCGIATTTSFFALTLLTIFSTSIEAQEWNRFRGPNGTGISTDDVAPPESWSPEENVKWKTELPGVGVSCPVIVGDKIFLTCYSGYGESREEVGEQENLKRQVVCVNRDDGSIVWSKTIDPYLPEDQFRGAGVPEHGFASHTPVSDGENLYVFLGKTGVLAFDLEGNQLWQTSVGTQSDSKRWGSSSSPIVHDDVVVVTAVPESRTIYGLNRKTGEVIWEQDADGLKDTWGTPVLVKVDEKRTDVVIGVNSRILGINPSDGSIRWYVDNVPADSFYSSVVAHDGVVYASVGSRRGGGSIAVKAGGEGNVTDTHTVWTGTTRNSYGTPVIHNGRMYLVSRNIMTTIDIESGEEGDRKRVGNAGGGGARSGGNQSGSRQRSRGRRGPGGGDYASPVIANGKLYFVKRNGETWVFDADSLEEVSVNKVTEDTEEFSATPAISNGQIFLRSNKHLYCVEAGE